ncbi:hypothetical protein [Hydrogenimonas sp.]
MSRLLAVILLLFLSLASAKEGGWDHRASFNLKKDRWQSVEIREGERVHVLKFRWTLYKNGGLIMHVRYGKRRFQPLLSMQYRLDAFKIELFPKADDASRTQFETPYALIVFKAFDEEGGRAYLDLMIRDYGMSEIFYTEGK